MDTSVMNSQAVRLTSPEGAKSTGVRANSLMHHTLVSPQSIRGLESHFATITIEGLNFRMCPNVAQQNSSRLEFSWADRTRVFKLIGVCKVGHFV